ncbi:hypothetical protein VP1G_04405 [Cytospora mali]|uniref:Congo red resistance-like protein 2 n=1 Tax=Cytospora mali TaxID=578113 RepID=A0A142GRJ7_CYTMA|nr:Congo red resistance-like protein 2 [Valsa mali var. pyri (nom. inval.)]KUI57099.1 hypothetical protein VP1G_04405 [Valsa mali var. pyri (nom. inval.)]
MYAYLVHRQTSGTTTDDDYFGVENDVPFWYTKDGYIVKWVVFLTLLVTFTAWVTIGHIHARRRLRKGLPPLAYHRWLVPRAALARVDPRYAYPPPPPGNNTNYYYRPGYQNQYDPSYNMQNMPPPPPMYDPNAPRPPMYEGPQGSSKTAPNQDYEAPSGPPPTQQQQQAAPAETTTAAAQPVGRNDTGSSNPFRL